MVGLSGLEPPTLRLSVVRSSQLSYKPKVVSLAKITTQRSVCDFERRGNAAIRSFRRQAETERAQFDPTWWR